MNDGTGTVNYEKYPVIPMNSFEGHGWYDYSAIRQAILENAGPDRKKKIIAVDTYPGVRDEELLKEFKKCLPDCLIDMTECFLDTDKLNEKMRAYLTDDRVFGRMYFGDLTDFWDMEKCEAAREKLRAAEGLVIVYGFGAALLEKYDLLLYCDMCRWEIQLRYRAGMSNYKAENGGEDVLKKFKRGYFVEWRMADKHKRNLLDQIDFYLDSTNAGEPKMISGEAFRAALREAAAGPFRTVPYFDPGVWGGRWMQEICNLTPQKNNYAWSFDGVPEENSLLFSFGAKPVQMPAMNLVLYLPKLLLGEKVYARFGAEFPIRFDFLDTMQGENLSLQVHPVTDYIHSQFGMSYTQDESYYILDAGEDACVYLGVREDTVPAEMEEALKEAEAGGKPFDASHYINCFPAKKHDHFLIPAGTIHCAGKDSMVLEISATPYIFTFKLWDWGRLGLDGKPRPIHLQHGMKVIDWNRRTDWVTKNLVNQTVLLEHKEDYREEHTGLHELEFIETRRYQITGSCKIETGGSVNMLNLVEGSAALIESPDGSFKPFTVHYAETFIIPAAVGSYIIRPAKGGEVKVIRAYVRD